MRGYVHPPETGEYIFWIASDDNSELWLSTDEDPANKVQIASVPRWTSSREWDKYASQQSVPISLMVGRRYYIEVLAKEGAGGDNLAVRWQLPGGNWEDPQNPGAPIPGIRLSQWGPVPDTSAPTAPEGLSAEIVSSTRVDLSWQAASDPDSGVLHYVVYRDGQEFAQTTTTSYSDTTAAPGVRHRYEITAVNPFYYEGNRSAPLILAPAGMAVAKAIDATTIQIQFTEPMDRTRAEQAGNYTLSAGATVSSAVLDANRLTVTLTTSNLVVGTTYTLTVNNLQTVWGVTLPANHSRSVPYTHGILWEYWLDIGTGNAVADLTSSANYPHNPSGSEIRSSFEAPTNWAGAYGGRMRGYITPTVTGNYWFWIASDDNGELWLSTDSNPNNKTRIANVPGWTSSREWTKFAQQKSALIPLVAGTHYYVEALMKEGGGGDNLAVTWQREGSTFDGLPIAAEFLTPVQEVVTLPFLPGVDALLTNDATPALSGTLNNADVAVTVGVALRYYAAEPQTGTQWLLADDSINPALADGVYDVLVSITDSSGRFGADLTANELRVDTVAPIVTVDPLVTNDPSPQLTGTVDDVAATVQVVVAGCLYDAVNHANGTWTLADDTISPLLANLYDVQATATDGAANIGVDGTSDELLVILHSPTDITLSASQVNENTDTSDADVELAVLSAVDDDPVDDHLFELVAGTGDTDNALFLITADSLKIRQGTVLDYEAKPSYSLRIAVTDALGNRFEKAVAVQVSDLLEVQGVVVNNGAASRSKVTTLAVTFDSQVALDPGAFEVRKRGAGLVDVQVSLDNSGPQSVATLTFSGTYTRGGNALVDGNYELRIDGSKVHSLATSLDLDGDADGVPGGDHLFGDEAIDRFFSFFGDRDGDRDVDLTDFAFFRRTYGKAAGNAGFDPAFDYDNDGDVDLVDFAFFRRNYGKSLPF